MVAIKKSMNAIIENLLELYNGGNVSDEYIPSRRQLKFIVLYWRATQISRDENSYLSDVLYQNLGLADLIIIDEQEDCFDETLGCKIVRTVKQVPSPIRIKGVEQIKVYYSDRRTAIPAMDMDRMNYIKYNKYTTTETRYYKNNNYIYLKGNALTRTLKTIFIRGIFENPYEAANFSDCDNAPCFNDDSEFPMPMDMLQKLTQAIINGELKITRETPEDVDNNGLGINAQ